MNILKNLSIIIPCYNEGEKAIVNIIKIKEFLSSFEDLDYEIIIVNDGSKDNTGDILKSYCKNDTLCKVVSYDENRGKGFAVKQGIGKSSNDIVVFMDADLSTDLSSLVDVYEHIDNYEVIIGSRRHNQSILPKPQKFPRNLISKICSKITNYIIPLHLADTQCGFKAFRGDIARDIVEKQTIENFAFDVELLYICHLNGFSIKETPVIWENDEDSKVKLLDSSILFFKDLVKIRLQKKHYIIKKSIAN